MLLCRPNVVAVVSCIFARSGPTCPPNFWIKYSDTRAQESFCLLVRAADSYRGSGPVMTRKFRGPVKFDGHIMNREVFYKMIETRDY